MLGLDLIECGSLLIEATSAANVTRFVRVPSGVTHLAYVCGMAYDSVGREVAIHQEVSWIDDTVAGPAAKTSNLRIPIVRDLAGVALIDSFYFAGLSGWGEPIRYSYASEQPMRLFVFLGTAAMASGGAFVRITWGRRFGPD